MPSLYYLLFTFFSPQAKGLVIVPENSPDYKEGTLSDSQSFFDGMRVDTLCPRRNSVIPRPRAYPCPRHWGGVTGYSGRANARPSPRFTAVPFKFLAQGGIML